MRVIFAGTPDVALPSLHALVESSHDVAAVLTRPPAPSGRGRALVPSAVEVAARDLGIAVVTARPRDPEFVGILRAYEPDCCPIVAYGELLRADVLEVPSRGWINLHFSLLPQWRGAAPVQAAVRHGDDITGATTFLLDEGMDTGPLLGSVAETIGPSDTSGDLLGRLAVSGAELLVRTLDAWEIGALTPHVQQSELATYAPKVGVDDARIDWSAPIVGIDRLIRACTPAPGAWSTFRGERIRLLPIRLGDPTDLVAGGVRVERSHISVGTATGTAVLTDVVPQGKRRMPATDWARGLRIEAGERFE